MLTEATSAASRFPHFLCASSAWFAPPDTFYNGFAGTAIFESVI